MFSSRLRRREKTGCCSRWTANPPSGFTALLDVRETDDEYLVLVDLPGLTSDDVTIEVGDGVLSISGSRAPVETGQPRLEERGYGSFMRTDAPAGSG